VCEACGYIEFGPLTLACAGINKELKFNIDTDVGRTLLHTLGSDDSRFASDPQFSLRRDASLAGWAIVKATGATNATFYNGVALPDIPTKLEEGGVISLGFEKLKLTVRLSH
jgi:hypothetical protein